MMMTILTEKYSTKWLEEIVTDAGERCNAGKHGIDCFASTFTYVYAHAYNGWGFGLEGYVSYFMPEHQIHISTKLIIPFMASILLDIASLGDVLSHDE